MKNKWWQHNSLIPWAQMHLSIQATLIVQVTPNLTHLLWQPSWFWVLLFLLILHSIEDTISSHPECRKVSVWPVSMPLAVVSRVSEIYKVLFSYHAVHHGYVDWNCGKFCLRLFFKISIATRVFFTPHYGKCSCALSSEMTMKTADVRIRSPYNDSDKILRKSEFCEFWVWPMM